MTATHASAALPALQRALESAWCAETAYGAWSQSNRPSGQCAVTALVVQDYCGGILCESVELTTMSSHYWNDSDGVEVDLTRDQFANFATDGRVRHPSRESLLSNQDTRRRYRLLSQRVAQIMSETPLAAADPRAAAASGPHLQVTVFGSPAPQGSKTFRGMSNAGRAILVESSAKVKPWREAVKAAIKVPLLLEGPLDVSVVFTLPKPKSAPKTRRTWPDRRPDLDKLLRALFDALGEAGAWRDDGQVVHVYAAKTYPGEGLRALPIPGAWIDIRTVAV